jgi:hypothetical protein
MEDDKIMLTHICQHMTSPPRMLAGTFSAEKTGDVVALGPIPKPSNKRQTCISTVKFMEGMDKRKWTYKRLGPCLGKCGAENAERTKNTTPEESATTTKKVVEGIAEPTAKKTRTNVRSF